LADGRPQPAVDRWTPGRPPSRPCSASAAWGCSSTTTPTTPWPWPGPRPTP